MTGLITQARFVSLEGGEGAGKTTVLNALGDAMQAQGAEVVCTRNRVAHRSPRRSADCSSTRTTNRPPRKPSCC